jgi:hypothetical protein
LDLSKNAILIFILTTLRNTMSSAPQEGQAAPNAGAQLGPGGVPFDPAMIEKFNENCFVRGGFAAVMGNY